MYFIKLKAMALTSEDVKENVSGKLRLGSCKEIGMQTVIIQDDDTIAKHSIFQRHFYLGDKSRTMCQKIVQATSKQPCLSPWFAYIQVIYGDCNASSLEMLGALSRDIMIPMISRASNEQAWPDVLSRRVSENLHRFAANGAPFLPYNLQSCYVSLLCL